MGRPTRGLTLIGVMIDDAVERGVLVAGSGSGSADGRIGGEWIIDAQTAAQAGVLASELLISTLSALEVPSRCPFRTAWSTCFHVERDLDAAFD